MRTNHSTAVELAFTRARIPQALIRSPLVARIVDSLARSAHARKKAPKDKGWSANLSYRTYRTLVSKGVLQQ